MGVVHPTARDEAKAVAFQNIGLFSSLTSLGEGRGLFDSGFTKGLIAIENRSRHGSSQNPTLYVPLPIILS